MKKIRLDVDALQVTSFAAQAEAPEAGGTVEGNQIRTVMCPTRAYATSPCDTCYQGSCVDSCGIPKTGQACYPC